MFAAAAAVHRMLAAGQAATAVLDCQASLAIKCHASHTATSREAAGTPGIWWAIAENSTGGDAAKGRETGDGKQRETTAVGVAGAAESPTSDRRDQRQRAAEAADVLASPPFRGTVWLCGAKLIPTDSPTAFAGLRRRGAGPRKMVDRRLQESGDPGGAFAPCCVRPPLWFCGLRPRGAHVGPCFFLVSSWCAVSNSRSICWVLTV